MLWRELLATGCHAQGRVDWAAGVFVRRAAVGKLGGRAAAGSRGMPMPRLIRVAFESNQDADGS